SIEPQPRNPRTVRVQFVRRTERPTPAANRAAPVSKPRLNRSLRDRDRFTRACASRRLIDPGERPGGPSVTFSALPETLSRAPGAPPCPTAPRPIPGRENDRLGLDSPERWLRAGKRSGLRDRRRRAGLLRRRLRHPALLGGPGEQPPGARSPRHRAARDWP